MTRTFFLRSLLLLGAACLIGGSALASPAACVAKLTFRRVFKGSSPEYIEISVREDSDLAAYEIRQLDEDAGGSPFQVGTVLRGKMFELAAELKHFQGQDLDVHRKIAYLGEKTFHWDCGTEFHEAKFNYTMNPAASQLLQIFEGLARQQEHADLISRRMKYDAIRIGFEPQPAAGTEAAAPHARTDCWRPEICGYRTPTRPLPGGAHPSPGVIAGTSTTSSGKRPPPLRYLISCLPSRAVYVPPLSFPYDRIIRFCILIRKSIFRRPSPFEPKL